jgi:hypothetical protein
MDNMKITSAQYTANLENINIGIKATIDGVELFLPLAVGNRHYDEIIRQVEAGTLTIQEAE